MLTSSVGIRCSTNRVLGNSSSSSSTSTTMNSCSELSPHLYKPIFSTLNLRKASMSFVPSKIIAVLQRLRKFSVVIVEVGLSIIFSKVDVLLVIVDGEENFKKAMK